eukprot:7387496-Prymnesium_polylepis.1
MPLGERKSMRHTLSQSSGIRARPGARALCRARREEMQRESAATIAASWVTPSPPVSRYLGVLAAFLKVSRGT